MGNYKPKICKKCKKVFQPTSGRQIYCKECEDIAYREYFKQYRIVHRKERREYNKQYRASHKEETRRHNKQYAQTPTGKEANRRKTKKYRQSPAGKKVIMKCNAKHRQLGFNPLNEPFENCEAHHINEDQVVYIPKELHKKIYHNLWTGKNMDIINNWAIQYLLGNYIIY